MGYNLHTLIPAGDMNAALFPRDVQCNITSKDRHHQQFAESLQLTSVNSNTAPHRKYTFRHTGDSDHDPILAQIPLTSIPFTKPGPNPAPLPREAKMKTPILQADLDAFKQELEHVTSTKTAELNERLDDLLSPADTYV